MIARKEANGKLKVTLFAIELQGGGRYSKLLDTSPRSAKLALLKILSEAAAITGFIADYKNLTAEILPNRQGGCVIYYSCPQLKLPKSGLCLYFKISNPLTEFLSQLVKNGWGQTLCSLYTVEQGYALLLQSPARTRLQILAAEYAARQSTSGVEIARVQEHGQPIFLQRPVHRALQTLPN